MINWISSLSEQLKIQTKQIENTLSLIKEDKSIPFIARYRKETTGCLDELQIRNIYDAYKTDLKLNERKDEILNSLNNNNQLTDHLKSLIENVHQLKELEEIYLPYKKKQKTKADIAKEKGLEPLADFILKTKCRNDSIISKYINTEKGVLTNEDALGGALEIIAENLSYNLEIRHLLIDNLYRHGKIICKKNEKVADEKQTYKNYYEAEWNLRSIPSWRILAINRAESEKIIKVKISFEWENFNNYLFRSTGETELAGFIILSLQNAFIRNHHPYFEELKTCMLDSYKRLLFPSIERECRTTLTEKAENRSVEIFQKNLRHLMLTPPLKKCSIAGIDPGFRTGCKVAIIDENGDFIAYDTIFCNPPHNKTEESIKKLNQLFNKHEFNLIAIGNGTASYETEKFIAEWIEQTANIEIKYIIVSEAGASVYSASDTAREEFPSIDVSVRGAISIARRVQDMMNELVKIPPESIGVGMYQHDISTNILKERLSLEVESVVNYVGIDLNQASSWLLQYISGFNKKVAKSIVEYRTKHQGFKSRKELLEVKGIGEKVFEQAAGFCRVTESKNYLDHTTIHPEVYPIAEKVFKYLNISLEDIVKNKESIEVKLREVNVNNLSQILNESDIIIKDIMEALTMRRRDPREDFPQPILKDKIKDIQKLHIGYQTQAIIRNVTDFGIFADIGTGKDGLIYRSTFTNFNPDEYFPGMIILTEVIMIDAQTEKIGLKIV